MGVQDDNWLRITGKVNIEAPLVVDTEYQFTGRIGTYGTDQSSKQDGTFNFTHKAQFIDEIHLIKGDTLIKAIDKERKSQKMRKAIYALGHEYDETMTYLLRNLEDILSPLRKQ
jgi:hypothetical protein